MMSLLLGAARAAELGLVLVGDTGTGAEGQRQVAAAMAAFCAENRCDAVLMLGDNFYPSGVRSVGDPDWQTSFEEMYAALDLPFYPALGNHDYYGNQRAQVAYTAASERWEMPARYHRFELGDVELFAIDTQRFDRAQEAWLRRGLEESDARWVIVYGHHPVRSYGEHGTERRIKRRLRPLVEGQADLYLAGHEHDLQVLAGADGTLLVVSGAGAKLRPTGRGPETLFSASTLGFCWLHVEGDAASLSVIDASGRALYTVAMRKEQR